MTRPVQPTLFDNPPDEPEFKLLPLDQYDVIAVSYSGGKDSLACLLHLLELGVPREKIELHHNDVDGHGEPLMDWPCTPAYVKATGEALGIPVVFSWRDGGFVREMLRDKTPTAPVSYEREGQRVSLPTVRATEGTRLKFPQVSADLSVRWCSAYLKIDPFARVLTNDPAYQGKKILVVTGERGQESPARSKYEAAETHRTNTKSRTVHQWRPILDWKEEQVWNVIERWRVRPHPSYQLGFSRTSCLPCIFSNDD
jgi:3'-phosphoadenosine 5'-phosphosulfate sulfotransferase (PAPS reductase)/FAD synthetase